ncbi:MAG: hypothetical protein ACRDQH_09795 [Pseudonocardiaceae bacterium]
MTQDPAEAGATVSMCSIEAGPVRQCEYQVRWPGRDLPGDWSVDTRATLDEVDRYLSSGDPVAIAIHPRGRTDVVYAGNAFMVQAEPDGQDLLKVHLSGDGELVELTKPGT